MVVRLEVDWDGLPYGQKHLPRRHAPDPDRVIRERQREPRAVVVERRGQEFVLVIIIPCPKHFEFVETVGVDVLAEGPEHA